MAKVKYTGTQELPRIIVVRGIQYAIGVPNADEEPEIPDDVARNLVEQDNGEWEYLPGHEAPPAPVDDVADEEIPADDNDDDGEPE